MENLAIVDLGSNSVRMAITQIKDDGSYQEVKRVKEDSRISEGMGKEKILQEVAMARTIAALKKFKKLYLGLPNLKIKAITTAAVRQARNQSEFLQRVEQEVGIDLSVLSGAKEAYYDYLGVMQTLKLDHCLILDTGGASCELILVQHKKARNLISIPVGAVTISEQYHLGGFVKSVDLFKAQVAMNERLTKIPWMKYTTHMPVVLLGGANRTLARMSRNFRHQKRGSIHGYHLSSRAVYATFRELLSRNLNQRKKMSGLEPERADIIIGGMLPLVSILQRTTDGRVIFSESGVREGIIAEYIQRRNQSK
jgi:exopolyphosphatase/guanosine-5'-triphosphate,3'-diphosphate pyrophosphatase